MKARTCLLAAGLGLALWQGGWAAPASAAGCAGSGTTSGACVEIYASGFSTSQLSVTDGTSVYFVNDSGGPATVTVQDDGYASGALAPGAVSPAYQPSQGSHTATGYLVGGTTQMAITAGPPPSPPSPPSPSPSASSPSPSVTASASSPAAIAASSSPPPGQSPAPRRSRSSQRHRGAVSRRGAPAGRSGGRSPAPSVPPLTGVAAAGGLPFSATSLPGPQPETAGASGALRLRNTARDVGLPAALAIVLFLGLIAALARVLLAEPPPGR